MRRNRKRTSPLVARLWAASAVVAIVLGAGSPAAAAGPSNRPSEIDDLSNGLAMFALAVCIGGICVSAALWAMGSKGQNPGTELAGKKGIVLCCTAAFMIGALPPWLTSLRELAGEADESGIMNDTGATSPLREAPGAPVPGNTGAAGTTPPAADTAAAAERADLEQRRNDLVAERSQAPNSDRISEIDREIDRLNRALTPFGVPPVAVG